MESNNKQEEISFPHEKGDYVMSFFEARIVKIEKIENELYFFTNGKQPQKRVGHVMITPKILEACGFEKYVKNEEQHYVLHEKEQELDCMCVCREGYCNEIIFRKNFEHIEKHSAMVLSVLQFLLRKKWRSDYELDINCDKLNEIYDGRFSKPGASER